MGIRLRPTGDRTYRGVMSYLVAYDHASGKKDRYLVLVLNAGDPVTIGRELDLETVRGLIKDYEEAATASAPFWGDRKHVLRIQAVVTHQRLNRHNRGN